ncbi:hypothetical protein ACFO1B_10575 [Dactylosporangium siamense]|uniref:Uncharacterized protein n=1 Tax=Dactylosporangium siamense TaxID=685454 RepID=A0A919PID4_9ACTN|nr:hypothetical protein [Dactylosporangium siamense]GIG44239.1 hypothetical protein Dsi01nite_022800 [Dactylosporangium siamense]
MPVRRLIGVLAGVALLGVSFATLFRADAGSAVVLRGAGAPAGCSAWTDCPGEWAFFDFTLTVAPVAVVGLLVAAVAFAVPWRVPLTVGYAVAAYVLLGLAAWQLHTTWIGSEESNRAVGLAPTWAFAALALAIAVIPMSAAPSRRPPR